MSDDLNAKATVEVDFIANGLTQLITGIGQLNEAQGFSNKANVQLEQGLTKVATQYGINTGAARNVAVATTTTAAASTAASKATAQHTTSLIATRYALYDVSNAMGIAGAALAGFAGIAYKTAIDYQSEFAAVARTTGVTGVAAQQLEANLIALSQALPSSFGDIASVAAMAGQLGIANNQVVDFTKNVVEFAATTNVSVDASATAFGRLNALLPDVQGNYNGLGSSILKVGINSVATESQIVTIASRIAGIGASAGLTSDQIIGLSGALASLGVQPYGASGTITRLFTKIETAVSQGGAALEAFGNISNETGAQFQASWNSDKTTALETLFSGINAQGPDAIEAIQSLGLTSAQDLPNLLKLSQNVDLVKSSLDNAATGMKDGTQLTQSYGIISDTVSAKIKILGNNFSALENAIGKSGAGIGGFLDVANGLLQTLTKMAASPVGSWFLGIGTAAIGLTGILALAGAGFLRLAATAAAVATADAAAGGSAGIFGAALSILTGATARAAAAQGALGTATEAQVAANSTFITSAAGVTAAVDAETFGMGEAAAGTATFTVATDGATIATAESAAAATFLSDSMVGATVARAAHTVATTAYTAAVSIANGTTLAGAVANVRYAGSAIAASTAVKTLAASTTLMVGVGLGAAFAIDQGLLAFDKSTSAAQNYTISLKNVEAALKGVQTEARNAAPASSGTLPQQTQNARGTVVNETFGKNNYAGDQTQTLGTILGPLLNGTNGYDDGSAAITKIDAALAKLVSSNNAGAASKEYALWSKAATDNGVSQDALVAKFPKYAAAMKKAGDAVGTIVTPIDTLNKSMADNLKDVSDGIDATLKQENALYALGDSLGQTGDDFSAYSAAGRTNLADLEAVVSAVSSQTAGDAQATADNLQGLFNALTQGAKIPAAALSFLSDSIASLGVKSIQPTTFDLASLNQGLGDGMTTAATKATKAANTAAKAVYTLVNYGQDLSGVFTRAFDIRYSGGEALDTITSGWAAIAKAASDAAAAEQKAQATLDGLVSDKAVDEYYLKVANAYGDTLRASQIQADLAQNASDTASANQDLATAQDSVNKTLVGNSDAAIANRSTILGLVTDYQSYITALASSGLSQAQLATKTAQLKQDFIQQATQLGFNKQQLGVYADSFDDVSLAISKVPRKITVSADANPALQALNEFLAQAKTAIGSGINVPITTSTPSTAPINTATKAQHALLWAEFLNANALKVGATNANLKAEFQGLYGFTGWADGGYTGDGGKYQPAGIVHAGEFVFSKEATSRIGVNNLAYAHSQAKRGYSDGGYVGAASAFGGTNGGMPIVQFSPTDRQLLMDIRDAAASNKISKASLAGLASSSNVNSANRRVA